MNMSDEKTKCWFRENICTDTYQNKGKDPIVRLAYCHNCLMGELVQEFKRLRITGIQS